MKERKEDNKKNKTMAKNRKTIKTSNRKNMKGKGRRWIQMDEEIQSVRTAKAKR